MTSKSSSNDKPVGVIGAGNFGSTVANLLAQHRKVLLYVRDSKTVKHIRDTRENRGHILHDNIIPTHDIQDVAASCDIIFPIVPSEHFRSMMKKLSPYIHPYHILIHGTKGFDLTLPGKKTLDKVAKLDRRYVKT